MSFPLTRFVFSPVRHVFGIGLLLAAAAIAGASDARAANAPYCAHDNLTGYDFCHHFSFQQCVWEMRAQGGHCFRNPDYVPVRRVKPVPKQRYYYR